MVQPQHASARKHSSPNTNFRAEALSYFTSDVPGVLVHSPRLPSYILTS